jgi:hypothetical protein
VHAIAHQHHGREQSIDDATALNPDQVQLSPVLLQSGVDKSAAPWADPLARLTGFAMLQASLA